MMYRMIGASLRAHAALNAGSLVNEGMLVNKADGFFGTYLTTRVRQAALAGVRNLIDIVLASVASELDDVDERRRIVVKTLHFGFGNSFGNTPRFIDALQWQTHRKSYPL